MATRNVFFKKFDPNTMIRDKSRILFAGGSGTGKSVVMRAFMNALKHRVYDCHIWSGSYDEEHPWEWNTPKQMVHYCMKEFDKEGLNAMLNGQLERKKLAEQYGAVCPLSMCVLEDLEFLKPSIWIDQETRGVMFNGRWYKLFFFVAYQYVMEVKMEIRGSFDYAVFTMEAARPVRERIWKQFAAVFPSFEEFEAAFIELTQDYRVMVVDLRARSYNVTDRVFWYKADPTLQHFRMGHPDVWAVRPLPLAQQTAQAPVQAKSGIVLLDDKPAKKKRAPRKRRIN